MFDVVCTCCFPETARGKHCNGASPRLAVAAGTLGMFVPYEVRLVMLREPILALVGSSMAQSEILLTSQASKFDRLISTSVASYFVISSGAYP